MSFNLIVQRAEPLSMVDLADLAVLVDAPTIEVLSDTAWRCLNANVEASVREEVRELAAQLQCDWAFVEAGRDLSSFGLWMTDMDSTLIQIECIDEIAGLLGIKDNELRMESLGYPVQHYKLVAFVIAGAVAGLAGALMANQNSYVSPNMLHWEQSGIALVMVILGGLGNLWGGLAGAAVFLILEEVLSAWTKHWAIAVGTILLGVVFFAPRGVAALLGNADG